MLSLTDSGQFRDRETWSEDSSGIPLWPNAPGSMRERLRSLVLGAAQPRSFLPPIGTRFYPGCWTEHASSAQSESLIPLVRCPHEHSQWYPVFPAPYL